MITEIKNNNKVNTFFAWRNAFLAILPLAFSVQFASAQNFTGNLKSLIDDVTNNVIGAAGTLFMALAVVAFFFGMFQFIVAAREGKQEDINNGKKFMVWGIISLFVIFSIYGIIRFAQTNLNIRGDSDIEIPTIRVRGSGSNNNNNNNGLCSTGNNGASCVSGGQTGNCQNGVCVVTTDNSDPQCRNRAYGTPCITVDEGLDGICSGGICTTSDPGLE